MRESVRGWRGERLKEARTQAQLTQDDLAGVIGCAHSMIARWERGQGAPSPQHARALAATFGLTVQDLTDVPDDLIELRDLRVWAGLTQGAVRQELGLHMVGAMESGSAPLRPSDVPALARLYGVDEDVLLSAADRVRRSWRARIDRRLRP